MNGFNQVTLCGNVTRQPELRYTPKGTAVADFGIAINKQWKDETGEKREKVTFMDVTAWSGAAEALEQLAELADAMPRCEYRDYLENEVVAEARRATLSPSTPKKRDTMPFSGARIRLLLRMKTSPYIS